MTALGEAILLDALFERSLRLEDLPMTE